MAALFAVKLCPCSPIALPQVCAAIASWCVYMEHVPPSDLTPDIFCGGWDPSMGGVWMGGWALDEHLKGKIVLWWSFRDAFPALPIGIIK